MYEYMHTCSNTGKSLSMPDDIIYESLA